MANRVNAKLILELRSVGMSRKTISRTRKMSMHTVMNVFNAADKQGVNWCDVKEKDNDDIYAILFPDKIKAKEAIAQPDYDLVHSELKKTGVTLKLLWEEYRDLSKERGSAHVSYVTFTRGYSDYVIAAHVTNHLDHKPGQVMEVDWSGATMRIVTPATGEITKAYLFVATLPYSQYTYVEATLDMKQEAWLRCHINAYKFFDGVALRCVCDNLKTGVITHPKEGEIILNEAYEALARHYVCAIMPTGVRKPKQKPSVEGSVGKIATGIIAKLRNTEFTSLGDLNAGIRTALSAFNAAPFQKREGSRTEVFEHVERECLAPLPDAPYELCQWVYARSVNLDFHVVWKTNRYSVPYSLVGKSVDLKITDFSVEVYDSGKRVAIHPCYPEYVRYKPHTCPEHMPPEFTKLAWDDVRMKRWAKSIGENTLAVVDRVFAEAQIKEQAYNPVMAILNLSKKYGNEQLEEACSYALTKTTCPRSRFLRTVLASEIACNLPKQDPVIESGGYVRGSSYYSQKEDPC